MTTEKTEKATDLLAAVDAFLEGIGEDVPNAKIEAAIRYAEHCDWMEGARAKVETEKVTLAARQRDVTFMQEFHAARLETERQRQRAADAESRYWDERTALLGAQKA